MSAAFSELFWSEEVKYSWITIKHVFFHLEKKPSFLKTLYIITCQQKFKGGCKTEVKVPPVMEGSGFLYFLRS